MTPSRAYVLSLITNFFSCKISETTQIIMIVPSFCMAARTLTQVTWWGNEKEPGDLNLRNIIKQGYRTSNGLSECA